MANKDNFNPYDVFEDCVYMNNRLVEAASDRFDTVSREARELTWNGFYATIPEDIDGLRKIRDKVEETQMVARAMVYFLERLIANYEDKFKEEE